MFNVIIVHILMVSIKTPLILKKNLQLKICKLLKKNILKKNKKDYLNRVKNIYLPKVEFLKSNVKNYKKLKILDVGTGSVTLFRLYIRKILLISRSRSSEEQVNYGKMLSSQKINPNKISYIPFNKLENF